MLRAAFVRLAAGAVAAPPSAPFAALEARSGGRLGVAALDLRSGRAAGYRAGERFPMCSTFKVLAVAAVLARVDAGRERLDARVAYGPGDLLAYAPVTRAHAAAGAMTVAALCEAAIVWSDNTAANLLLRRIGGPAGVTRYARALGDPSTRLDRREPDLNTALPGDPRDTTTPAAMARNLHAIVAGNALAPASRARLASWLVACRTGTTLLRAGFPLGWRVGDKSGSGGRRNRAGAGDTRNDVAVAWPPGRAPIVAAAYLTGSRLGDAETARVLAAAGRELVRALDL